MTGRNKSVKKVRSGLITNMITRIPVNVNRLVMICTTEVFKVVDMLSISFVILLMMDPCCRLSKNESGSVCRWEKRW